MDEDERLTRISEQLGHTFHEPSHLLHALTHRSYAHEQPRSRVGDNERLEFLGDSIVGAAAAEILFQSFPNAPEGELTRRRAELVCERSLAKIAEELELGEALRLGRGEERSGGRKKPRLLASALEACIGAVFLDGGFTAAHQSAHRVLTPAVEMAAPGSSDFKSRLQEQLQGEKRGAPRYEVTELEGPEHARIFHVAVTLDGARLGEGSGRNKLEAEQSAAQQALSREA
jgi:ribonuclease-3